MAAEATCDVICVGAGVPKRGMGWYHAKQILDGDTPSASLSAVVEPWFLGPGADSPPGATFAAWAAETGASGVAFCESVADVPKPDGPRMALISGRTADNPRLLREVIEAGCTAVYLEKPGAPTVEELESMRKFAAEKKVPVYMGYNKNVTPYVRKALEEAKKAPGSVTTYVHNNAYTEAELPECFERNSEGLLKNMVRAYIYICVCVCICFVSSYVCVCLCLCVCVCVCVCACMYVRAYVFLSVCPSLCVWVGFGRN